MLWGNFPSPRKRLDLVGGGYADLRSLELSGNLLETWEVSPLASEWGKGRCCQFCTTLACAPRHHTCGTHRM